MTEKSKASSSRPDEFLSELRRRRVLPIAGAYIAIAWLVTEIAGYVLEQTGAPAWSLRLLAIVFMVGFPITVVLAWVIQVRPDGKRTLDPSKGQHKTVAGAVVLGIVATAGLAWLILPRIEDVPTVSPYDPMPNSVAVLPFLNPDATPREVTIGNTLYTALTDGLNASDVTQITLKLKQRPADLTAYGRSVRVATLLSGHLLRSAGSTQVELTLLDVGSGKAHWTRKFDWDPTQIMELGTEIANNVLQSMELPILTTESFAGTGNPEAYDAFLSGEQLFATNTITKLEMAMDEFQRAIDLDPNYALAYVSLAETIQLYLRFSGPQESERKALSDRAMQALEKAQELDSDSPAVISALGLFSGSRELAFQSFEHALEIDPNHAKSYHRLGIRKQWTEPEEAERLIRKALEYDPRNADWRNDLAGTLWAMQQDEEALAEIRRSIEIEPELVWNNFKLAIWMGFSFGRLDEALIHTRQAYALDPRNQFMASGISGWYGDMGAKEEALAWMERSIELGPGYSANWFFAYMTLSYFGYEDKAFEYAERSLEMDSGNTYLLRALGSRDIKEGRAEQAIERWELAYPVLTTSESLVVDDRNWDWLLYFAQNLVEAGELERAQPLLNGCLEAWERLKEESSMRRWEIDDAEPQIYASLGLKEETLEAMRRAIIDGNYRITPIWYDLPVFDFVRNELEFQELMAIWQADLAEQRKRVRAMECNGELAATPGVEPVLMCD